MKNDIHAWQQASEEAARAGAAVLEQWRARFSVREKGRADLVTEADHASQHVIRELLLGRFPGHAFLGEEDPGAKDGRIDPDVPTWIVDPLDGTANYVHDVPAYCVSIGLMLNDQPVAGCVYDPRQNEMFSAGQGLGATLNGRPIRVSEVTTIGSALLSTGFPPDPKLQARNLAQWQKFTYLAQGLRRTGSTALNLAYVAAGRFDGYWAFDNFAWDIAGGVILVREAGGMVTCVDGSPSNIFRPDILAASPVLHSAMLPEIVQRVD